MGRRWIGSLCLNACLVASCTQYKPNSSDKSVGNAQAVPQNAAVTDSPTSLVLSNTKLLASNPNLTAKINYGNRSVSQDFKPTGTQSVLSLANLVAGSAGIMTIEIYQGELLLFVAKRSNTTLQKSGANNVVVDDCLILPAPWSGTANDGSCEWSIAEVAN